MEVATTVPDPIQPLMHVGIPELIEQSASSTRIQPFRKSMLQGLVRRPSADIKKDIFELNMHKSKLITHYWEISC
jgi:hypothetical protein